MGREATSFYKRLADFIENREHTTYCMDKMYSIILHFYARQ